MDVSSQNWHSNIRLRYKGSSSTPLQRGNSANYGEPLFDLDPRLLDDRPLLLDFCLVVSAYRLGSLLIARRDFLAEVGELGTDSGIGKSFDDGQQDALGSRHEEAERARQVPQPVRNRPGRGQEDAGGRGLLALQ